MLHSVHLIERPAVQSGHCARKARADIVYVPVLSSLQSIMIALDNNVDVPKYCMSDRRRSLEAQIDEKAHICPSGLTDCLYSRLN